MWRPGWLRLRTVVSVRYLRRRGTRTTGARHSLAPWTSRRYRSIILSLLPEQRKQRRVHRRALRQPLGQARELGRGAPGPRRVHDVVAHEAHREGAATAVAADPAGGVQSQHVEEHAVARFELPAHDREGVAVCLDVGQVLQAAL